MPFLQLWYPILPLDKADQGGRARKWIKGKGKWGFPPLRPVVWEAALPIRINANTLNVPDLALIVLSTAFNHFLMLCCNDLPNAYILKQMEGTSCLSPSTRHAPKPGEGTILKKKQKRRTVPLFCYIGLSGGVPPRHSVIRERDTIEKLFSRKPPCLAPGSPQQHGCRLYYDAITLKSRFSHH